MSKPRLEGIGTVLVLQTAGKTFAKTWSLEKTWCITIEVALEE